MGSLSTNTRALVTSLLLLAALAAPFAACGGDDDDDAGVVATTAPATKALGDQGWERVVPGRRLPVRRRLRVQLLGA